MSYELTELRRWHEEKVVEARALMLGAGDSLVQRLASDSLLYPVNGRLAWRGDSDDR